MSLFLTTPPAVLPVSLAEVKAHLRVDTDADDTLILTYVASAVQHITDTTGRQLITAGYTEILDGFPPGLIRLPVGPVQAVTEIRYFDGTEWGALDPSRYRLMAGQVLPTGAGWPCVQGVATVAVGFTAGYGATPDAVPVPLLHAILLLVGYWYEERSPVNVGNIVNEMPFSVAALLAPYRRVTLA